MPRYSASDRKCSRKGVDSGPRVAEPVAVERVSMGYVYAHTYNRVKFYFLDPWRCR